MVTWYLGNFKGLNIVHNVLSYRKRMHAKNESLKMKAMLVFMIRFW